MPDGKTVGITSRMVCRCTAKTQFVLFGGVGVGWGFSRNGDCHQETKKREQWKVRSTGRGGWVGKHMFNPQNTWAR